MMRNPYPEKVYKYMQRAVKWLS